jgi:nucleoside-diphosphate-sugar epimerase
MANAGHDVVNVDKHRPTFGLPGGFIQCDLTDGGEVYDVWAQVRPEAVCHLAANPSPSGFPRPQTFANNVQSTYLTMQASGDLGTVRRYIYASSEMATGWLTTSELPPHFPFNETDRADTPNAYALSKYLGEVIADSLTVRYPEMPVVSLRINNVICPPTEHDKGNYHWLAERRANFLNNGAWNWWSYIDARDVATAFRASVEGDTTGHEVFLIAARDTCLEIPTSEALNARHGDEGTRRLVPNHGTYQSVFDCSKIERTLGWVARHSWRDEDVRLPEP